MLDLKGKKSFLRDTIFWLDDNTLLKLVANDCEYWQKLKAKNLSFINNPLEISSLDLETSLDTGRDSLISLEYLKEYKTLSCVKPYTFDSNQVLLLMKKAFELLKKMHDSSVFHGDISDGNIMIDDNNNIKFIDFENGIVDNIISSFCYFSEGDYWDYEEIVSKVGQLDVCNLLYIFLKYLNEGDFDCLSFLPFDLNNLGLPKDIQKIFNQSINNESLIKPGYYFLDEINYLLSIGYESPMLLTRK